MRKMERMGRMEKRQEQDKEDSTGKSRYGFYLHRRFSTEKIIGCSFEIANELGVGFLESVYKIAL